MKNKRLHALIVSDHFVKIFSSMILFTNGQIQDRKMVHNGLKRLTFEVKSRGKKENLDLKIGSEL